MKKLHELRSMILETGGKIEIGKLSLKHEEGKDVDVYLGDTLVMWISSSVDDDASLNNIDSSVTSDLENAQKTSTELESTKNKLEDAEEEIKRLKADDKNLDSGKVEAYEKLFVGKNVTITQI